MRYDSVARDHVALHPGPSKFEVSVVETKTFFDVNALVDLEGRVLRRAEHLEMVVFDFKLSGY